MRRGWRPGLSQKGTYRNFTLFFLSDLPYIYSRNYKGLEEKNAMPRSEAETLSRV